MTTINTSQSDPLATAPTRPAQTSRRDSLVVGHTSSFAQHLQSAQQRDATPAPVTHDGTEPSDQEIEENSTQHTARNPSHEDDPSEDENHDAQPINHQPASVSSTHSPNQPDETPAADAPQRTAQPIETQESGTANADTHAQHTNQQPAPHDHATNQTTERSTPHASEAVQSQPSSATSKPSDTPATQAADTKPVQPKATPSTTQASTASSPPSEPVPTPLFFNTPSLVRSAPLTVENFNRMLLAVDPKLLASITGTPVTDAPLASFVEDAASTPSTHATEPPADQAEATPAPRPNAADAKTKHVQINTSQRTFSLPDLPHADARTINEIPFKNNTTSSHSSPNTPVADQVFTVKAATSSPVYTLPTPLPNASTTQPTPAQAAAKPAAAQATSPIAGTGNASGNPSQSQLSTTKAQQPTAPRATNPQLAAQISRSLASAIKQNQSSVSLRLTPAALGTLKIDIRFNKDTVSARIRVTSEQARSLLENSSSALREALHQRGITLDQLRVELDTPDQPQGSVNPDGQHAGGDRRQQRGASNTPTAPGIDRRDADSSDNGLKDEQPPPSPPLSPVETDTLQVGISVLA